MAPLTTTRTLLELRVGSIHTIEILLQIRLSDIAWWNSDLYNCERQLYKLIGRRVLPTECHEEIEADRARFRERTQDTVANGSANNETKNKTGKAVIGEANLKKKKREEKEKGGKKRGAAAGKKGKKETKKSSKKQKVSDKDANESDSKGKLKLLREPGKWIMGKSIQICKLIKWDKRYDGSHIMMLCMFTSFQVLNCCAFFKTLGSLIESQANIYALQCIFSQVT